jgi:hypothetical protein
LGAGETIMNRVPTKLEIKALEDKARALGNICCKFCNIPTGVYRINLRKLPEGGGYACKNCRPELFDRR